MTKLRFVTDSTADIPKAVREEYGIEMVPLKVHFGSETYLDSITLQPEEFYPKLIQAASLPTTSQPSPVDFLDVYKKLLEEDPEAHIISIHLSSALSGTYQSAELAKSLLELPDRITIIDSLTVSYGIGMMVVAAAEAARQGRSLEEILELVGTLRETNSLYFLVDTLEYLQKGGRIGKAAAALGSLLNIKPILSIDDDGEVTSVDKVRGSKKAVQRIIELLKQDHDPAIEVDLTLVQTNDMSVAEDICRVIKEHYRVNHVQYVSLGPVLGTHVGPGTVGVFMGPSRS